MRGVLALIAATGLAGCGAGAGGRDVAPQFLSCLRDAGGHMASRAELRGPARDPRADVGYTDDVLSYRSITVATRRAGVRRAVVVLPAPGSPFDAREFVTHLRGELDHYRAVIVMPASRDPSRTIETCESRAYPDEPLP